MKLAVEGPTKTYTFLHRAPHLSRSDILRSIERVPLPEGRRTARSATSRATVLGLVFPFDAIEEAWWGDGGASPGRSLLTASGDPACSVTFDAVENVVMPRHERGGQVKLVMGLRRRSDVDTSTFSEHWATTHQDVVLRQERMTRLLRGYVQNHTVPGTVSYLDGRPVPEHLQYDGVIEQWFDSVLDAVRAYGSRGYLKNVRADESDFINARRAQLTFVSEVLR